MQLQRCLTHFPSHVHTLHCWSSSPALRKASPTAENTGRREEWGKYILFVADCVFLSPLLSSGKHSAFVCLRSPDRQTPPSLRMGKGQEKESWPGLEEAGFDQHPGQGRTRRSCSPLLFIALPCLSFFPLPCLPLALVQADEQPPGAARPCFALQPAPAHFFSCLRANSAVDVRAAALKLWLRSGLFLQINPLFYQI